MPRAGSPRFIAIFGRQQMKVMVLIAAGILAMLTAGCASLIVHCSEPPAGELRPKYVYSGAQVSAQEIGRATDYMNSPRYGYDAFDPLWPFAWLLLVADFPLTVVTDTLFLPYDAYRVTFGGRDRYGVIEDE